MDRLWNPPCVAAVLSGLTQDKQLLYGSSAGLSGSLEGSPAAPQAHISLGRYFKGNEFSEKDWGGGAGGGFSVQIVPETCTGISSLRMRTHHPGGSP